MNMDNVIGLIGLLLATVIVIAYFVVKAHNRNEWLKALLDPSISLATLMHSLNTVYPSVFSPRGWDSDYSTYYVGEWSRYSTINLSKAATLFSDRMMWRLIDVFVRNAQLHFGVLSNDFKDGESLIRHMLTEIMLVWGSNTMKAINSSSLSEETKRILLSR